MLLSDKVNLVSLTDRSSKLLKMFGDMDFINHSLNMMIEDKPYMFVAGNGHNCNLQDIRRN